jgi:hypothetical protein
VNLVDEHSTSLTYDKPTSTTTSIFTSVETQTMSKTTADVFTQTTPDSIMSVQRLSTSVINTDDAITDQDFIRYLKKKKRKEKEEIV